MKQLTWLASESRMCADGDSEDDPSPTSAGSQEEEEEEEGPKEEGSGERRSRKVDEDQERPSCEGTPRGGGGRCPRRGRGQICSRCRSDCPHVCLLTFDLSAGRSRPLRGLRSSRQERSKDLTKLFLLYDENILDKDPHRDSKDLAFAQSYLNRVGVAECPVDLDPTTTVHTGDH